jgi:hypothetical protein
MCIEKGKCTRKNYLNFEAIPEVFYTSTAQPNSRYRLCIIQLKTLKCFIEVNHFMARKIANESH